MRPAQRPWVPLPERQKHWVAPGDTTTRHASYAPNPPLCPRAVDAAPADAERPGDLGGRIDASCEQPLHRASLRHGSPCPTLILPVSLRLSDPLALPCQHRGSFVFGDRTEYLGQHHPASCGLRVEAHAEDTEMGLPLFHLVYDIAERDQLKAAIDYLREGDVLGRPSWISWLAPCATSSPTSNLPPLRLDVLDIVAQ